MGFSGDVSGKGSTCQRRRHKRLGFSPWVGKIPWRRAWQPTPVFLPGESHRQRSLVGPQPTGHKESDTTGETEHARKTSRWWSPDQNRPPESTHLIFLRPSVSHTVLWYSPPTPESTRVLIIPYPWSPCWLIGKDSPAMRETGVQFLGWEDPLEKEMETHSSILSWRIPWTEEIGGLQSLGHKRVRRDIATKQ